MTLPVSGAISLNQVNVELGAAAASTRSLNDSTTRTLFGVASGAISMSNGYGKANAFSFSVASNTSNANLRTLAINAGWNGTTALTCTLNSGIYFSSTAVGTPALTINGSFPGGVTFVNNGTVVGDGGNGGGGSGSGSTPKGGSFTWNAGGGGGTGGLALLIQSAVSIQNNGTIAGGGGGGGGGGGMRYSNSNGDSIYYVTGGGGGGGRSSLTNSSGGSPRGGTGTINGQGGGGSRASAPVGKSYGYSGAGGVGGAWGSNGAGGSTGYGSNFSNVPYGPAGGGGGGGAATSGQSNVTWLATGTRLGSLG